VTSGTFEEPYKRTLSYFPTVPLVNPIGQTKLKQQLNRLYTQKRGTAVASDTGTVVHVCYPAGSTIGTVVLVQAGICVAGVSWAGGGQLTVDVKKNGTTIMSSPIVIDGTTVAFAKVVGAIASASYSNGDVFEVVTVFTAGTGTPAQGLFVQLILREPPQ
jgi:hypothetical protein